MLTSEMVLCDLFTGTYYSISDVKTRFSPECIIQRLGERESFQLTFFSFWRPAFIKIFQDIVIKTSIRIRRNRVFFFFFSARQT